MFSQRQKQSVMLRHYSKSLVERCSVVLYRQSTSKEITQHAVHVPQLQPLLLHFFHYSYAPVNVCRKPVLRVKRHSLCYVRPYVECLVAHQHTVLKRLPRQFLWRIVFSLTHKVVCHIHYIRVTIYHAREG